MDRANAAVLWKRLATKLFRDRNWHRRKAESLEATFLSKPAVVKKREGEPGVRMEHPAIMAFAESLHQSFVEGGAVNYMECGVRAKAPDGGWVEYTVTVQRKDKPTAHQFRVKAERERDAAIVELAAFHAGSALIGNAASANPGPAPPRVDPSRDTAEHRTGTYWARVDLNAFPPRMFCLRCATSQTIRLPEKAPVLAERFTAFGAAHAGCVETSLPEAEE